MRLSLAFGLVTLFLGNICIADEAPATLRVDFFHSGNVEMEMFSLDQVVIEPLPWTGNMHQPLDNTLRGKYLFEIVDPESAELPGRAASAAFTANGKPQAKRAA